MNFDKRRLGIIAVVVVLAVLNLWRWWPETPRTNIGGGRSGADLNAEEFVVQGWAQDAGRHKPARDLFFARGPEPARSPEPLSEAAPAVVKPMPTAQALARERARESLAAYRLEGILSRQGRWEAFVSKGEERFTVVRGSVIQGRYIVDAIDAQGAVLRERGTNIKRRIELNGKE